MRKIPSTIFFLLFFCAAWGQVLTVKIDGDITFPSTFYTINEAGEDFQSSAESQTSIFVSVLSNDYWDKNVKNANWRIYLHKSDLNWNAGLTLEAKRTGTGNNVNNSGTTHIGDGDTFQAITDNPTYFFNGKGEIEAIPVEIKLSGFSITMGANDFETNVVLTVYEE